MTLSRSELYRIFQFRLRIHRRMQLQVLLISTVEKSTAIQPYCDITYSIVRHGDVNAIAPFYRLNPSDSRQEAEP